jgi:sulfoxide reductase catalytic subunit YedY
MLIKNNADWNCRESEVTPEPIYLRRREFMGGALAGAAALSLPSWSTAAQLPPDAQAELAFSPSPLSTQEEMTPYEDITRYNNFYEFGTGKEDPARNAANLKTDPWSIEVQGECDKPGTYHLEDILKPLALEERIYRLRCVEAWSMVVPWIGFPLSDLLARFQPNSRAKYVKFETLLAPEQMPGQRSRFSIVDWPYQEGLRVDEAMNPLTIMAVGLYGKVLPNQNGAPIRLVVPWKYGFKSIKSIVSIRFQERQPRTSWVDIAPNEYGFYANVNPQVDHPRWSQAEERRLPSGLFNPNRIDTQMFNGYGEYVADLYAGMDLKKFY